MSFKREDSAKLEKPLKSMLKIVKKNRKARVDQVIEEAVTRLKVERYEAARLIYKLKDLGYIRFIDPNPPGSLL